MGRIVVGLTGACQGLQFILWESLAFGTPLASVQGMLEIVYRSPMRELYDTDALAPEVLTELAGLLAPPSQQPAKRRRLFS